MIATPGKPVPWVVARRGVLVFVERKGQQFATHPHIGVAESLAKLLNSKDREIDRLKRRIYEMEMRS